MTDKRLSPRLTDRRLSLCLTDKRLSLRVTDKGLSLRVTDKRLSPRLTNKCLSLRLTDKRLSLRLTDKCLSLRLTNKRLSLRLTDKCLSLTSVCLSARPALYCDRGSMKLQLSVAAIVFAMAPAVANAQVSFDAKAWTERAPLPPVRFDGAATREAVAQPQAPAQFESRWRIITMSPGPGSSTAADVSQTRPIAQAGPSTNAPIDCLMPVVVGDTRTDPKFGKPVTVPSRDPAVIVPTPCSPRK